MKIRIIKENKQKTIDEGMADHIQAGLTIAGFIPGIGEPLDLVNAGISLVRGKPLDAVLNAVSALGPVGDVFGKGSKALIAAVNKGIVRIRLGGKVGGTSYSLYELADYLYNLYNGYKDKLASLPGPVIDTLEKELLPILSKAMDSKAMKT